MKPSQATLLIALLQAAFPRDSLPDVTVTLYAERLAEHDYDTAARGVKRLIDEREDTRWPAWATIRKAVNAERPPLATAEPLPDLDEQQRAENKAKLAALTARIGTSHR